MPPAIGLVLAVLLVALVRFIVEWVRMNLVALLGLAALALSGLVSPAEAFSSFSNPAVITVWAMFIMSEGLFRTGTAFMALAGLHPSGKPRPRRRWRQSSQPFSNTDFFNNIRTQRTFAETSACSCCHHPSEKYRNDPQGIYRCSPCSLVGRNGGCPAQPQPSAQTRSAS